MMKKTLFLNTVISGVLGVLVLSGCENSEAKPPIATPSPIVSENNAHQAHSKTFLQDGEDAFAGFEDVDIFDELTVEYATPDDGIRAFIDWFELSYLASQDGVRTKTQTKTSEGGDTTWSYVLTNLPDDATFAENYKAYFEKTAGGYKIAKIGYRVKCYRNETPDQWTTEICP
jgi:hypothetical protein